MMSVLQSLVPAILSGVVAGGLSQSALAGAPVVPGFEVSEYATTPSQGGAIDKLTIDPGTGAIYLGQNDATGSIYRVPPGGGAAVAYGTPIPDPDAVLFDADGAVSGVAGAVIVGGLSGSEIGQLWAVMPDEQVVSVCGPTTMFRNPTSMTFDAAGTMVIADFNGSRVVAGAPCPSTVFQSPSSLVAIDLDDADDIYTAGFDGIIRIHSRAGVLVNASFASGLGSDSALQFGPGGPTWGDSLYVIDKSRTGELRRYAADGSFEIVGTGFTNGRDLEFGPDGAMYVSMFEERRVLRIAPLGPCPADLDGDGSVGFNDLTLLLGAWGPCSGACPEDLDGDGSVGFNDLTLLLGTWGPCD
jgi:sugar lactone lactonase YvrE